MREIKFRAWDKEHNEMRTNKVFDRYSMYHMSELNRNIILMQYTGLKDKNGVDIYEGDVLQWFSGTVCEVYWDKIYAGWMLKNENESTISKWDLDKDGMLDGLKIIGNIYENPELMLLFMKIE